MTKNNSGLKAAILTMSFIQMATNAVSSILANIAMEFPDASVTTIQYLMTFPNLMIVAVSVIAAGLAEHISKRTLAATGLLLATVSGILSFAVHGSILILYVWAGMLGIGVGLVVPMANSLISDYFQGNERDTMLGYQTGAANAGSMIMTYVGGVLATIAWQFDYLVYLLAIPGLILTLMFVPKQNVVAKNDIATEKKKFKIVPREVVFCIVAAVYMLMFYLGPTNIALYFSEKQIGNTMTAGTASSLLLLGGVLMGFFFGKLAEKIGKHTITLGFVTLFVGYTLIYIKGQLIPTYIGCLFVGMSNPLVMPQCMGSVVTEDKQRSTVMMSVVFAIANLGTFLAPGITTISRMVMHAQTAASRFAFAGIVTGILACVSFVWIQVSNHKTKA
ncbi:MFS transporter [Ruminococcus sp.]|uniref:MFS transporter n=1 Tax=Ruminococcus sp. TaxID=41978 RepID=UPI003529904B